MTIVGGTGKCKTRTHTHTHKVKTEEITGVISCKRNKQRSCPFFPSFGFVFFTHKEFLPRCPHSCTTRIVNFHSPVADLSCSNKNSHARTHTRMLTCTSTQMMLLKFPHGLKVSCNTWRHQLKTPCTVATLSKVVRARLHPRGVKILLLRPFPKFLLP